MIDHLEAVARRMGGEYPPGLRIERCMVEPGAFGSGDFNDATLIERHD
jgi:hypothetical protein